MANKLTDDNELLFVGPVAPQSLAFLVTAMLKDAKLRETVGKALHSGVPNHTLICHAYQSTPISCQNTDLYKIYNKITILNSS